MGAAGRSNDAEDRVGSNNGILVSGNTGCGCPIRNDGFTRRG